MARRRRIDDHMLLVPGEVIQGHHTYTVEQIVGSGAYACVYRAKDELGRVVALKEYFPPNRPREAASLKNLFERERYVMTQVSPHPHVPTFYEGFIADNQYYLAQEFIEGRGLDEIIRKDKKIEREWMLKWAMSLCEALSYLHERQIVHHDLKPPNIRITPDNHLKLLDYGAAVYFGKPDKAIPEVMLRDTELFGTEGYLPPEVEETFKADIRTDIFGLGCVLYEMIMGDAPEQQSINERNLYVVTPLMERKDVDLALVKIASTALSYNTEFRFASVKTFADELRKMTQAMLMVSQKSVYFGTVDMSKPATQKFRIFNNGGKGDLVGEVKPLVSWLSLEVPGFKTQKRDVVLIANPSKVKRHNQLMRGQVEIITKNVVNASGQLLARADRWVIDCYITVNAKPAQIVVDEINAKLQALTAQVRPGQPARLSFTLTNKGEVGADTVLRPMTGSEDVQLGPDHFLLKANESVSVVALVPARDTDAPGSHRTVTLAICVGDSQVLTVQILVMVLGTFDYLKNWFTRQILKRDGMTPAAGDSSPRDVTGARTLPPPTG